MVLTAGDVTETYTRVADGIPADVKNSAAPVKSTGDAGKVAISGDLREIKRTYPRDKIVVSTQTPAKIKADLGDACTEREDGTLIIKLASPDEKQAMMKRLVESYDIDEVKVFEPSLNDIFVEYAGAKV
jgi:ABC-2 type transport system ATP-binding protein